MGKQEFSNLWQDFPLNSADNLGRAAVFQVANSGYPPGIVGRFGVTTPDLPFQFTNLGTRLFEIDQSASPEQFIQRQLVVIRSIFQHARDQGQSVVVRVDGQVVGVGLQLEEALRKVISEN